MRSDYMQAPVPSELKQAEEMLERYGAWAQDRYKKQRCGSAEGNYNTPSSRGDTPIVPFIPDWSAMQVQHALQVVPMQFRRVLLAYYIPQRKPWQAARRVLGGKQWDANKIAGLRSFWSIYCLRYLKNRDTIAAITRD